MTPAHDPGARDRRFAKMRDGPIMVMSGAPAAPARAAASAPPAREGVFMMEGGETILERPGFAFFMKSRLIRNMLSGPAVPPAR